MLKLGIRFAIALLIIGVLVWIGDGIAAHWAVMSQLTPLAAVLALVAITLGRTVMAYKWLRLMRCFGAVMPLSIATQIYCAANIWGLVLPSTLGVDAVRTVCASREGLPARDVIASILVERGIGFIIGASLCLVSVLYLAEQAVLGNTLYWTGWFAAALIVGLVIGMWLSFSEWLHGFVHDRLLRRVREGRIARTLRDLHSAYLAFRSHRGELLLFLGLTVVENLVTGAAFWLIAWGLGVSVGLVDVLAVAFVANLVSRVPISFGGGLGVFEAMFVLGMSVIGIPTTEALSVALLGHLFKILSWLPWWIVYTLRAGRIGVPASDRA